MLKKYKRKLAEVVLTAVKTLTFLGVRCSRHTSTDCRGFLLSLSEVKVYQRCNLVQVGQKFLRL